MSCNLCEDDYGMSFCENDCSYHICSDCCTNLKECPQCKGSLRIIWFFAGKISMQPHMSKRRLVGNTEVIEHLKKEMYVTEITEYKDYTDLSKELPIEEIDSTNAIAGPFMIMKKIKKDEKLEVKDITNITDIVNIRNTQMIQNCDVFSLEINNDYDCFRSFAEWGMALIMGKVLILVVPVICKNIEEFYTYASDSIKSFEKVSFYKREAILRSHPLIKMNYKQYKKHMEQIISFKKQKLTVSDDDDEDAASVEEEDNNEDGDWDGYMSEHVG
jgi:hypothetical protein